MKLDIRAGKRVLYKHNKQWCIGLLTEAHNTKLTDKGLFLSVIPVEFRDQELDNIPYLHDAELNDIFLDGIELTELEKNSDMLMTKEAYEELIEDEDFMPSVETAYVSDGEYYYYPVSKYNKTWLEKQPFNYIMRMY